MSWFQAPDLVWNHKIKSIKHKTNKQKQIHGVPFILTPENLNCLSLLPFFYMLVHYFFKLTLWSQSFRFENKSHESKPTYSLRSTYIPGNVWSAETIVLTLREKPWPLCQSSPQFYCTLSTWCTPAQTTCRIIGNCTKLNRTHMLLFWKQV